MGSIYIEKDLESSIPESPKFGDYVKIEQKRFGAKNEMYRFKVIGSFGSNCTEEVPMTHERNVQRHESTACLRVIVDGVCAELVHRVRLDQVVRIK